MPRSKLGSWATVSTWSVSGRTRRWGPGPKGASLEDGQIAVGLVALSSRRKACRIDLAPRGLEITTWCSSLAPRITRVGRGVRRAPISAEANGSASWECARTWSGSIRVWTSCAAQSPRGVSPGGDGGCRFGTAGDRPDIRGCRQVVEHGVTGSCSRKGCGMPSPERKSRVGADVDLRSAMSQASVERARAHSTSGDRQQVYGRICRVAARKPGLPGAGREVGRLAGPVQVSPVSGVIVT